MIFNQTKSNNPDIFDHIIFRSTKIIRVNQTKFLGLCLDSGLSFSSHVDHVKSKVAKFVGVLSRISKFTNVNTKLKIYYAYINSQLIYLNPIWSAAPGYKLKELQTLQNRAIKYIYGKPFLTPSISLYGEKHLPLNFICEYETILIIFKIRGNKLKSNLEFTESSLIHSHFTRIANYFRATFMRTNLTQNSIYHHGLNLFNKIPDELKNENVLSKVKYKLKNYLKIKYQSNPSLTKIQ